MASSDPFLRILRLTFGRDGRWNCVASSKRWRSIRLVGRLERPRPERARKSFRRPRAEHRRLRKTQNYCGESAIRMETVVRSRNTRRATPPRARALDHLVLLKPRVMSL